MNYECDNGRRQIVLVILFICFLAIIFIQKTQITGLVIDTENLGAFNQVIGINEIFVVMIALGIISGCFVYAHKTSFLKKMMGRNALPIFSLEEIKSNKEAHKLKDKKGSIVKKVPLYKESYYSASHNLHQQKKKFVKWFKKNQKHFTKDLHQYSHDLKIIVTEIVGYLNFDKILKIKKRMIMRNNKSSSNNNNNNNEGREENKPFLVVKNVRSKDIKLAVQELKEIKKSKIQILQNYEDEIERKLVKMSLKTIQDIKRFKGNLIDIDKQITLLIKKKYNKKKIVNEMRLVGFSKKIVLRHYNIIKEEMCKKTNKPNKRVGIKYSKNSTKFDQMITGYIMDGMSKEQIKRILLNSGWPKSFVKEHYEELHKEFEKEVMKISEENLKGDQLNLLESHLQKELEKINKV
ncbi:MAG: hypothetical protein U9R08_07090 [Nanoarchaeota archaeon]|nr:hypothetical protein [Nanoarchaeota archaeon]